MTQGVCIKRAARHLTKDNVVWLYRRGKRWKFATEGSRVGKTLSQTDGNFFRAENGTTDDSRPVSHL